MDNDVSAADIHRSRSQLDAYEDFGSLKAYDLKLRIEEMLRIKVENIKMYIQTSNLISFINNRVQYQLSYVN